MIFVIEEESVVARLHLLLAVWEAKETSHGETAKVERVDTIFILILIYFFSLQSKFVKEEHK